MNQEMFSEIKKKISENEKNEEIYSSLISFLKIILYRGAGVEAGYLVNSFYYEMNESGLLGMIENKVREIVFSEGKKNSEMSECERDMILGYSFMMKWIGIEKELLLKLWKCLIFIVHEGISKEKKREEREGLIGLRCICEDSSFFFFFFFLYVSFFISPLCTDYFSFYFIIFLDNREALRDASVVSEVKEIREEYEKEVERRGKGESEKRKVDKISFMNLLQTEFMLISEFENEKKKRKNPEQKKKKKKKS
jgi:hypothetical protein